MNTNRDIRIVRDELEYLARTVASRYKSAGKNNTGVDPNWIVGQIDLAHNIIKTKMFFPDPDNEAQVRIVARSMYESAYPEGTRFPAWESLDPHDPARKYWEGRARIGLSDLKRFVLSGGNAVDKERSEAIRKEAREVYAKSLLDQIGKGFAPDIIPAVDATVEYVLEAVNRGLAEAWDQGCRAAEQFYKKVLHDPVPGPAPMNPYRLEEKVQTNGTGQ